MQQTQSKQDKQFQLEINFMRNQDKKVLYEINIQVNNQLKKSFRRYSELRRIHSEMQNDFKQLKENIILPIFPGSSLFGKTNNSEKKIKQRKEDLFYYFQDLLKISQVLCLPYIKELFPQNEKKDILVTYDIRVIGHTNNNEIILYKAEFTNVKTKESWTCNIRYSNLRNLHQILNKQKNHQLPEFPQREIIGKTSESSEKVQKRQTDLENYLNKIFHDENLVKNVYVQYLLNSGKQENNNQIEIKQKINVRGDLNENLNEFNL